MGNIDFRDPSVQIAGVVIFAALTIAQVFFLSQLLPFGFKVRANEISALQKEYEGLTADLMKAKQTASRLPQVRSEYEQLSARWEEAKSLLPTEKEMAELLAQVTVAGQRSGVDFLLFEPRPPAPREIYFENPIEVSIQGGYHEIGMFLGRVSNLPRIINVKSIDLKNVPNPVDSKLPDLIEAKMSLTAYTLISEQDRARNHDGKERKAAPANARGGKRGRH